MFTWDNDILPYPKVQEGLWVTKVVEASANEHSEVFGPSTTNKTVSTVEELIDQWRESSSFHITKTYLQGWFRR